MIGLLNEASCCKSMADVLLEDLLLLLGWIVSACPGPLHVHVLHDYLDVRLQDLLRTDRVKSPEDIEHVGLANLPVFTNVKEMEQRFPALSGVHRCELLHVFTVKLEVNRYLEVAEDALLQDEEDLVLEARRGALSL